MQEILQGKYRILHEVGQGGMAVVYKGIDMSLDREVAVKVLHPHLANRTDSRMRFHREAKAVAKLHHPNILEIYDYSGLESDESWIVTEYIRGETLKDFTDRNAPRLPEVGALVVHEVAAALSHAHQSGIIHRDIKPENIMIRDDGVLKLMDFGIAQIVDMQAMTVTGALVGSPAHMSPEHVEGKPLDFRADIFSLGTLLYMLCAGRLPFDSASPHALLRQILEARYDDPRLHNPAISRRLYGIVTKCLQKDPNDRFETVESLRAELAAYLGDLGLSDPAGELETYFDDPPTAEAALEKRVVERLMGRARDAAGSGQVASALEAYNQVLALEGDREDALAQVQRLSNARSRMTFMKRAAVATVAVAGVAAVTWRMVAVAGVEAPLPVLAEHVAQAPPSRPLPVAVAPAPRVEKPVTPPTPVPVEPAAALTMAARENDLDERVARREPEPSAARGLGLQPKIKALRTENRVPTPPAGPEIKAAVNGITFAFTVVGTQNAEIVFEGQHYTARTPKLTRPGGTYRVTVHHPECAVCEDRTYTYNFDPKDPPPAEIPLAVGYKPAVLTVVTQSSASVLVAGHKAEPGQPIQLKMKGPKLTVDVLVRAKGFKDAFRKVVVEAGASSESTVSLVADDSPAAP